VAYRDARAAQPDLDRLPRALAAAGRSTADAFVTAAFPGVIAMSHANLHYPTHVAYVAALADAMAVEYRAVIAAGFSPRLDAPDLEMGRHAAWADASLTEFRDIVALHIAALNQATASLPPERMRLHLCWGNYDGPHHHDVPMRDIVDLVLTARPDGLSFEAANPRHAHEWRVWEEVTLPDATYLIPVVIDTTPNDIEHPGLVAERLTRFSAIVGPERIVVSADCGLSPIAGYEPIDPDIAWAKLAALVEGARRASVTW